MLRIPADSCVSTFSSSHAPAATVGFGESFICESHDCYGGQVTSEAIMRPDLDMSLFDRATGPVKVSGAHVGDVIKIVIEELTVESPGVMMLAPGLGVLGDDISTPSTRLVEVREGTAWVNEGLSVPTQPMVGVLGVAPAGDDLPCFWPGDHGGNLDTRVLQAGTSLYLRVNYEGALIGVGDFHALQGDGELGGTGIEIGGSVRLRVERTNHGGQLPAIRHDRGLSIVGTAPTLEEATRRAFSEAVALVAGWHLLEWQDAYRLTSLICRTELSQMVNPLFTMRVTIPESWLPGSEN